MCYVPIRLCPLGMVQARLWPQPRLRAIGQGRFGSIPGIWGEEGCKVGRQRATFLRCSWPRALTSAGKHRYPSMVRIYVTLSGVPRPAEFLPRP